MGLVSVNAQIVKSYLLLERIGQSAQGPIPGRAERSAVWVEWNDDQTTCKMLDNTTWKYKGTDAAGNLHYAFAGANGPIMPFTQYQEAIFTSNFAMLQVVNLFGLGMCTTQIISTYNYAGDGVQIAYDYINGNF